LIYVISIYLRFPYQIMVKSFYIKTTGATSGTETAYTSYAHELIPSFQWASRCSIYSFLCVFCWPLLSFCHFFVLSVLLSITPSISSNFPFFYRIVQNRSRLQKQIYIPSGIILWGKFGHSGNPLFNAHWLCLCLCRTFVSGIK